MRSIISIPQKIKANDKDQYRILYRDKKYGNDDFQACFNCGNCTATCNLTDKYNAFPRKLIRYSVLGLKDEIESSLDPWMCYYCGDCTTSCPRKADPGALMMTLRRYLSASYDWTGLARKFYTSKAFELGAILFLSLVVMLLFIFFHGPMTTELTPEGESNLTPLPPGKPSRPATGSWPGFSPSSCSQTSSACT